ncbi:glycosyl transferase group 2 [Cupriavidus necator N-1]|uniref:Glycosyl transferase group 2 n=1 Tax=Cupriavidus necator (strain ATCC 43291 / DSM 13513 / CCUG 52238 / LMG 8453 / N-1) TaxID=1042878 RepID=G0ETV8_CUPNN|nr:glycosyltransferase family 4 protein [Cupriavidus necator]AEI78157.1 glycosyl transferase group 2 [Cupriavidus necator N-1]MDX6013317.1 glycosyltransferase family 4 protein [Cupriavidus necator]
MRLMICAIDIFVGDAVGNHCLGIARCAQRSGWEVRLYARNFDIGVADIRPISALFDEIAPDDLLLVSYSIVDPQLDRLLALPNRKACYFHGVTDPELLQEFEPRTAELCAEAIRQLPRLVGFDVLVANSHFTAGSLVQAVDNRPVHVIPPVFADMPGFERRRPRARSNGRRNLLMVGRVVPHKRIEDALEVLQVLRHDNVEVSLSIVGSTPNHEYLRYLINRARALGILEYLDFKGVLDDEDLLDCFEDSDVMLVMSRHEGFCVPVLEAMFRGMPALVRGGTAAEELCDAGDVYAPDATAGKWAAGVVRHLDGSSVDRAARVSRALEVLDRASDSHWAEVLAFAREGGRK